MRIRLLSLAFAIVAALPTAAATTPAPGAGAPAAKPAPAPATAAPSQVWFVSRTGDGAIGYNASSIKADPQLGTIGLVSLYYMKAGAPSADGTKVHFIHSSDTFDCVGMQFKPGFRNVLDFGGKTISEQKADPAAKWMKVDHNSPLNLLRNVACSGATFKNMQQATNFAAAIAAMKALK
jgi:hypothetical protein